MQRVLILGCPGSGKTTLAKQLGAVTGLPVVHLDRMYWRAGWVEPSKEEWFTQVRAVLAEQAWIMDGNYGGTMELRLQSADAVVFLDLPTEVCLWRVIRRVLSSWGRDRADMAAGCAERLDLKFLLYVATFRTSKRAAILRRLERFEGLVYQARSTRDAQAHVARIAATVGTRPALAT